MSTPPFEIPGFKQLAVFRAGRGDGDYATQSTQRIIRARYGETHAG